MSAPADTETPDPPAPSEPEPPAPPTPAARWRALVTGRARMAVLLPLLVVLCAGGIRYYQLGNPSRCYFDETYYYYDARDYLQRGTEASFAVHPPVGKWIIATGLAVFGVQPDSPIELAVTEDPGRCIVGEDGEQNIPARAREAADAFARRAMSALFGTAAVAITYLVARRLLRRRAMALLAATLLAVDGLAITMSRIAMLDIFLQAFTMLGVLALLIDRDRLWAEAPRRWEPPPVDEAGRPLPLPSRDRRWLWVAGLTFGLAVATKWTGLAPLGLAWVWVAVSELAWRRRWTGRLTADLAPALARGFLALVAVPVAVYLLSYAGWFANFEDTRKADRCADGCGVVESVEEIAGGWWEEQREIFRFHRTLEAEHPYRAPATTWALMTRPVAYYYESCPSEAEAPPDDPCVVAEGNVAEVLGMGTPTIWWMALVGYPFLLYLAVARRDPSAATIALFLFGQVLPYLAAPRPVFLFYMTPMVPFIALTLAHLAEQSLDQPGLRWIPTAVVVLALAGFVFWAPVFLGLEIPREMWDRLILIKPGWI